MNISNNQYTTSQQTIRNTHIKIELLDFNFLVVDRFEGHTTGGSINIDATADIRRTCSITMVLTDNSFVPQSGGRIWIDKYVRISMGVDDIRTGETAWTNMGIYLINQPSYKYDATTKEMTFEGVDLMAKMTGARNGYLTGVTHTIPQGSNVRDVIITILTANGFGLYLVSECQNTDGSIVDVPYNIDLDQGSTWYDMLVKLRDILPNYQMYFDVDGVFHYEPIPSSSADPVLMTDDIWKQNVIGENISVDFESVKNSIEVYGGTHSLSYYSDVSATTISSNAIQATVSGLSVLSDKTLVGFVLPTDASGTGLTLNVSGTGVHNIVDYDGHAITTLDANTIWCVSYDATKATWLFLGHAQAKATAKDENPESPFFITPYIVQDLTVTIEKTPPIGQRPAETIGYLIGEISEFMETNIPDGTIVAFDLPDTIYCNSAFLGVQGATGSSSYEILSNYRPPKSSTKSIVYLEGGHRWVVKFQAVGATNGVWKILGKTSLHTINEIKIVLYGGEYEDIQSDYLAQERANFELYKRCRLNDTITLTSVPIYWTDVNIKAQYTPLDSNTPKTYTVQTVSIDLGVEGTMSVNMAAFYPYYPEN